MRPWIAALVLAFLQDGGGIVIRSTTALVEVRVVAEDADGRPVTDLRKEDFQIQDDRKLQPIAMFSADRGGAPGGKAAAAPEAQAEPEPAYALLVLDWLNTRYTDQLRAQEAAVKLLKRYQPNQQVAVYVLSHQPYLLSDFTSDTARLAQAVADAGLDSTDLGKTQTVSRFDARYSARGPAATSKWTCSNGR